VLAACGADRRPLDPGVAPAVAAVPSGPDASAPSTPQEPDGNDDELAQNVELRESARFVKVGRHYAALGRICDFAVHGGALYMAHATEPLGLDGATVTRFQPDSRPPFSLAFDWNRPGQPAKGGGAGQGFLRVRRIDTRLYVPDADPPYLGLGLARGFAEGYVFVSGEDGRFEPARRPGHLPPKAPTAERGGAALLPGALHVFDVVRFRGHTFASTGAVVAGIARKSPGTLFRERSDGANWEVFYTYLGGPREGSSRLGYMVRFKDRLYVAISPLEGHDRNDYVVIEPPREDSNSAPVQGRAVSIVGGAHTLRWYADHGHLFWIVRVSSGSELLVSDDGERWSAVTLPADVGSPTDVLRVDKHLFVLAERALLELGERGAVLRASVDDKKSPFTIDNGYCAAPLVAFGGKLYAGAQKKGSLYTIGAGD